MSYLGFGIQNSSSMRRPRRAFVPVFEQLSKGDYPTSSKRKGVSNTWKEFQSMSEQEEVRERMIRNQTYLLFAVTFLSFLVMSMI